MDPAELAERTGLPTEVVRAVLENSRQRRQPAASPQARGESEVVRFAQRAASWFAAITKRPVLFVAISTTIMMLLVGAIGMVSSRSTSQGRELQIEVLQGIVILLIFVLQMATLYRHARARVALYSALVFWLILTPPMVAQVVRREMAPGEPEALFIGSLVVIGFFALSLLYAGLGVAVSVVGGFMQVRRADQQRDRLTRQQLLQRLFEIEERLKTGPRNEVRTGSVLERAWVRAIRERIWLWAVGAGAALSLIQVLGIGGLQQLAGENSTESALYALGALAMGVATALVQIALCFLAGRPGKGVAVSLAFTVSSIPATFIPLGAFGWKWVVENAPEGWISTFVYSIVIGLIAGLGALIEERAALEARLMRDDPAALIAEMVEIQMKLTPTASLVCVMVVDAAKSSLMKSEADPLVGEYTFREYQKFIADTSAPFGGRIHSTAGDGAVVYFDDCQKGFMAARAIQTEIAEFNQNVSKLPSPFRLRIGLHCGSIAGDLEKVEFTEVIDIAAHVEAASQVGGILVTEPVARFLEGERLAELRETIDGYKVFLALNPMIGP